MAEELVSVEGKSVEAPAVEACECPPVTQQPEREEMPDPRGRLMQLASELMRSRNRRLVVEYLRLRRAV